MEANSVLQVPAYPQEIHPVRDLKSVMKKMAMVIVGITLFVAGYRHTQRQNQYFMAKAALANPGYATTPAAVSEDIKHTVAFRFVKPS